MSQFSELANDSLDVVLGGKALKVRRLSLDAMFGEAESAVISEQIKRIYEMAERLDGEEKTDFLAKAMLDSIPSGEKLAKRVQAYLRSLDGIKRILIAALKADQPSIESEMDLSKLVRDESEKINSLLEFLMGNPGKVTKVGAGSKSDPLARPMEEQKRILAT